MDIIRKADRRSVRNQFYSDLVTPVVDQIEVPGNRIHVFYAEKMGEKYLKRYYRHYKKPDVISFPMSHEGWLKDPELMITTFEKCMNE